MPPTPSFKCLPRLLPARERSCCYLLALSRTGISFLLLTQKNSNFIALPRWKRTSPRDLHSHWSAEGDQCSLPQRQEGRRRATHVYQACKNVRLLLPRRSSCYLFFGSAGFLFPAAYSYESARNIAFYSYSLRLKYNCLALSWSFHNQIETWNSWNCSYCSISRSLVSYKLDFTVTRFWSSSPYFYFSVFIKFYFSLS